MVKIVITLNFHDKIIPELIIYRLSEILQFTLYSETIELQADFGSNRTQSN